MVIKGYVLILSIKQFPLAFLELNRISRNESMKVQNWSS